MTPFARPRIPSVPKYLRTMIGGPTRLPSLRRILAASRSRPLQKILADFTAPRCHFSLSARRIKGIMKIAVNGFALHSYPRGSVAAEPPTPDPMPERFPPDRVQARRRACHSAARPLRAVCRSVVCGVDPYRGPQLSAALVDGVESLAATEAALQ